jgi:hypothetical protein
MPKISDNYLQRTLAMQHPKNRWWTDLVSLQSKQELSSTFLILDKLSLVNVLLFAKSHKKICSLGGTESFHMIGVNTCLTPLLLITAYKDWIEYIQIKLPYNGTFLFAKLNAIYNLKNFIPLLHNPIIHCSMKSKPQISPIQCIPHRTTLFTYNEVNLPIFDGQASDLPRI